MHAWRDRQSNAPDPRSGIYVEAADANLADAKVTHTVSGGDGESDSRILFGVGSFAAPASFFMRVTSQPR